MAALVSVVLDPGQDADVRARSVASLEAQTHTDWEVVAGPDEATGEYVAFLDAGDTWVPERLERLVAIGAGLVADRMEGVRGNGDTEVYRQPRPTEAARLLIRRDVLRDGGGIDPGMGPAWPLDFLMRNQDTPVEHVDEVGVRRFFPDRRRAGVQKPGNFRHVVLNRHLVDWAAIEARPRIAGVTTVIVPTYEDWELTTACVESLAAADDGRVEVVVWDNGSAPEVAARLDALVEGRPRMSVEHWSDNLGFALGNNMAFFLGGVGDVVVFLNNDTTVPPGWIEPLRAALEDPDVLGVQPLLVYPTGEIQSAGIAFPSTGGLPHQLLQGFQVEDAAGLGDQRLHALTGAALALRADDVIALRGFDPIFTNGMEDVDLCQRLEAMRPGHFRVVTEAPVVHHESRSPGRYLKHLANRRVYLDRWAGVAEPRDDEALWGCAGYTVVDHRVAPRKNEPVELAIPQPVLTRERRAEVSDRPLRWAIKNPAPGGEGGERWGDTHFASSLAVALRDLGHHVVVDRRPEWDRTTGVRDDVALVLRGLDAYEPAPGQVTIAWVISHPGDVTSEELRRYDRVAAASLAWSERVEREWGVPVEPLLQATDPALFHPHEGVEDTGAEVLFVGNSRRVLRPVVRDALAAGLPLTIYGDLWSGLVPDERVAAQSIPNADLSAAYAAAGVVLNDHWADMAEAGFVSNRLFDAVASGARVISDDVAGVAGLFGDSVQVYRDVDDLRRLASDHAVFGDAEARRAAAERVRTEHSFAARAETLVRLAHEASTAKGR